jgi:hypothetical protein
MALEGLLAEVKAAVPKNSKQSLNAEKVAMLSHLSKLLKEHLKKDRKDSRRGDSRAALIEQGVPLEHQKRTNPPRVDTHWRNSKIAEWKRGHPAATSADVSAQIQFFQQAWSAFSPVEREEALSLLDATLPPQAAQLSESELPDIDQPEAMDISADWWDCGNYDWPVRPQVVQDCVHSHQSVQQEFGPGIANKAHKIRQHEQASMIVNDAFDIPDDRRYSHRHSCTECHPGLCATRDADVYLTCLALAKNLEAALGDKFRGQFVAITNPQNQDLQCVLYCSVVRSTCWIMHECTTLSGFDLPFAGHSHIF